MVEDNPADALLLREAIGIEGLPLELCPASDGELALAFVDRTERDPEGQPLDAVLLDLNLPKVDGFTVLRRIRTVERFKTLPVIVLSSSDSPRDRSEGARLGAFYFRKGQSYDEFLKIGPEIRRVLEQNGLL
jgi:chemotaxis family two-component system response regulator Rcp1